MKKILIIEYCDECPHYDNKYYDYARLCEKLDRKIEADKNNYTTSIPNDCPLETVKDDKE